MKSLMGWAISAIRKARTGGQHEGMNASEGQIKPNLLI